MKKFTQSAAMAVLVAGLVIAPIAEAKRVGGGRSSGMARSSSSHNSAPSRPSYNTNNYQPAPVQQRSGSGMGKVVAAGVAGAAIGAVAGHAMANNNGGYNNGMNNGGYNNGMNNGAGYNQAPVQQNSGFSWFWLLILGGLAFFIFRKFMAKKAATASTTGSPNTTGGLNNTGGLGGMFGRNATGAPTLNNPQPTGGAFGGGAYTNSGNALPDGTEPATFLRFARQRFNHIQSMNNASNIQEIRRYFTADEFNAIQQDISSNTDVAEFNNLTANVVGQNTENGQHVVSVRFSGLVSEDLNSPQQPFSETWHFVKPVGSQNPEDWLVAGIQQD